MQSDFYRAPLRVLCLTPGMAPGGAEMQLATLIRHAERVEYVRLIAAPNVHGLPAAVDFGATPTTVLEPEPGASVERLFQAAIADVREQYDIVFYWGLPKIELRHLGKPVVRCIHFSGVEETNAGHAAYQASRGETTADYLAAVCESAAAAYTENSRRGKKVEIIHNGADVERVTPKRGRAAQREIWGIASDRKVVLYVGRFYEGKGADRVIDALEYLPEEWTAVLVGWGSQAEALRQKASKHPGRVLFPQPTLKHLGDIYAAADVVALPSNSEAFPLVMIEAWLAGKPFVCNRWQTIDELEAMACGGLTVECGAEPNSVALSVVEAANQGADGIRNRANNFAFCNFTASAMVNRWENYFYSCLADWMKRGQFGQVESI